jgi:hypothetical protein
MTPEVLASELNREPFLPLRVHLSHGRTIDILNPGLVVLMTRDIFIADASRDRFHIFALIHIVGVESLQAA